MSRETRSNPDLHGVSCIVKFLSHLGTLLLLSIFCLTPVVACMAPEAQMTAAERACCHIMKNECGQMQMPVSHGCCQKTVASANLVAIDKKAALFHPSDSAFVKLMTIDLLDHAAFQSASNFDASSSPPGRFAPTLSSLRI